LVIHNPRVVILSSPHITINKPDNVYVLLRQTKIPNIISITTKTSSTLLAKEGFIATKEIGAQSFSFVHSSVQVTAINFTVFPLIFQAETKEEKAIHELFLFHSPTNK
jgi:hypothetical protein